MNKHRSLAGMSIKSFKKKKVLLLSLVFLTYMLGGCVMKVNDYSNNLYEAIKEHDADRFHELLNQGGELNKPRVENPIIFIPRNNDYENVYPIEIACKEAPDMALELLSAGADPNIVDDYLSSTPLIYALETNKQQRFNLAMTLIEYGVNINHVDALGRTALNASVEVLETDGEEVRDKSMELLKYLLENADVPQVIEQSGNNPLNAAAQYNNLDAIKYIVLNKYIDINTVCGGYTPLMQAVLAQNEEACELLLSLGADKGIVSAKNKTAYDYAVSKKNDVILRMLK